MTFLYIIKLGEFAIKFFKIPLNTETSQSSLKTLLIEKTDMFRLKNKCINLSIQTISIKVTSLVFIYHES